MTDGPNYRPRRAILPDDWDDDPDDDLDGEPVGDLDDDTVPRSDPEPESKAEPEPKAAPEPYVPTLSFAQHEPVPDPDPEPAAEPEPSPEPKAGTTPVSEQIGADKGHRSHRPRMVLAGVAALLVVVVAIAYTVTALNGTRIPLGPLGPLGPADPATSPSSSPSPSAAPAVNEQRLLDTTTAAAIDDKATWSIARTQTGRDADSPLAVCLQAPESSDPAPKTSVLRTLTASGKRGLAALHQADAYGDSDQAVEVFSQYAQQLGGCTTDRAFLVGSTVVENLGDQAITVTVDVAAPTGGALHHTVLVVRTGTVINIVDASATDKAVDPGTLAAAIAPIINQQCADADGRCAQKPKTTDVVPPIGAEVPGLPALADVPRLDTMSGGHWSTTEPLRNSTLPEGSQCERLDATKVKPATTLKRAYLVQDDDVVPDTFGWDLVLFSFDKEGDASGYLKEVRSSIDRCSDRQKSAKVTNGKGFKGTGTEGTTISAYSWNVRQPTGTGADQHADYRLGLAVAGDKVVYLFLPIDDKFNFTDEQWEGLVIRAAQRATQVS